MIKMETSKHWIDTMAEEIDLISCVMEYHPSRKNRLNHILDNSRTRLSGEITDLATQSENNYQYDAKGRLTST